MSVDPGSDPRKPYMKWVDIALYKEYFRIWNVEIQCKKPRNSLKNSFYISKPPRLERNYKDKVWC